MHRRRLTHPEPGFLRLACVSAVAIVLAGCGGSDLSVIVVNRASEQLIVQVEHPDHVATAWSIDPNGTGTHRGVLLGSSLRIFTDNCVVLGEFFPRREGIGRSPVYAVHENGTIDESTALDILGAPGSPPRVHDPCQSP
jgi:hypothetical protein